MPNIRFSLKFSRHSPVKIRLHIAISEQYKTIAGEQQKMTSQFNNFQARMQMQQFGHSISGYIDFVLSTVKSESVPNSSVYKNNFQSINV